MILAERVKAAINLLDQHNWDLLVITNPADFFWLTGCKMVGPGRLTAMVLAKNPENNGRFEAIVPNLAAAQVETIKNSLNLHLWKDGSDPIGLLLECINKYKARTVAFSGGFWSQHLLQLQARAPELNIVDGNTPLAALRAKKDPYEVEQMREACARLESALYTTLKGGVIGRTEAYLASQLFQNMIKEGLSILGGWIEFATGINSADPTHTFNDKVVQEGDPLLIDWGATYNGYYGDLCRTPVAGQPSDEFIKLYTAVQNIMESVSKACVAGRTYGELDQIYQQAVYEHGYDDHHIHRLGHGIGLIAHDVPFLQIGNQSVLEESHTFTLEPGIYIKNTMGARIEHNLVFDGQQIHKLDTGNTGLWCIE